MKKDVGMACQEAHRQGYKSEGRYTKPRPYIFTLLCKDVGMDEALYIDLHFYILPCLHTFWHAIPTSVFIFNDFSVFIASLIFRPQFLVANSLYFFVLQAIKTYIDCEKAWK